MSTLLPHIVCLVEVGEHSPIMQGYEGYHSPKSHCGGAAIYVRKDLQVVKKDTGLEFVSVVTRPNKESIICFMACYISPNKGNQGLQILDRIETYAKKIEEAYSNITINIFGDFNHFLKKQFSNYTKKFPNWTYRNYRGNTTITDMFLTRNNSNEEPKSWLEDYSNNSCFGSSDHRLLTLKIDVPKSSSRNRSNNNERLPEFC